MYQIKKELHPEKQLPSEQNMENSFCMYPIYTSRNGLIMLETRKRSEIWRSEDNGKNWFLQEKIVIEEKLPDGNYGKWSLSSFFYDERNDILIQFLRRISYSCPVAEVTNYFVHLDKFIPNSVRTFYRISTDGGKSWNKRKPFIENGEQFNDNYFAEGYYQGKDILNITEVPTSISLEDGIFMLPFQGCCRKDTDKYGSIQAGRFFGRWDAELQDYRWDSGGRVPGGGCEQTIECLKDGRLLNIIRGQGNIEPYYFDERYRPYSISKDDGKTWSKPEPFCWNDGKHVVSPRAWSQLVRAQNGKLYWIANIWPDINTMSKELLELAEKSYRADPRYPLVIAEVDEENITLKRETATTIIDREEGETKFVRYSNFFCYNDRVTGEIVMYMLKAYSENQPNWADMPHPAWRFRIKV